MKNATVVPSQAVQTGKRGDFIYVVKSDSTVEQRPVKVARTIGGDAVISSGIEPGETVVTDGQLRLIPGIKVEIVERARRAPESLSMTIAEPFIRRPIMTTLVMAAILLFGMLGYRSLAVSDLPNVDFPTIQVSANLPGANPDTMAAAVATPLEKQFSTIAGIDSMTSTSTLGSDAASPCNST